MYLPSNGFTSLHLSLPVKVALEGTDGGENALGFSPSSSGSSRAWSSPFIAIVGIGAYCPEPGIEEEENALEGGRRNRNVRGVMKGSI